MHLVYVGRELLESLDHTWIVQESLALEQVLCD